MDGTAPPIPSPGQPAFGPYQAVRKLAAGGMGVVFEAIHPGTGARYAVKTVLPGAGQDPDELLRFRREGELLARLDHPNVVRVHSADLTARVPYLVQTLLTGGSLQARLEREGPLPIAEAVTIVATLAGGLAHAHAGGVLHRDLKPLNVLFDERGQPVLVDFGLGRASGAEAQRLTATGAVLGTPGYMAPEQARGEREVDARADVYGLGAVLYALLTGRPPFQTGNAMATLVAVAKEPPPPPRRLRPDVPVTLEQVCLRALAKDPAARFPDALSLAAAAEAALHEPARRPRARLVVGGLIAGAGAIAALAIALGGRPRAPDRAPNAPSSPAPTPAAVWDEQAATAAFEQALAACPPDPARLADLGRRAEGLPLTRRLGALRRYAALVRDPDSEQADRGLAAVVIRAARDLESALGPELDSHRLDLSNGDNGMAEAQLDRAARLVHEAETLVDRPGDYPAGVVRLACDRAQGAIAALVFAGAPFHRTLGSEMGVRRVEPTRGLVERAVALTTPKAPGPGGQRLAVVCGVVDFLPCEEAVARSAVGDAPQDPEAARLFPLVWVRTDLPRAASLERLAQLVLSASDEALRTARELRVHVGQLNKATAPAAWWAAWGVWQLRVAGRVEEAEALRTAALDRVEVWRATSRNELLYARSRIPLLLLGNHDAMSTARGFVDGLDPKAIPPTEVDYWRGEVALTQGDLAGGVLRLQSTTTAANWVATSPSLAVASQLAMAHAAQWQGRREAAQGHVARAEELLRAQGGALGLRLGVPWHHPDATAWFLARPAGGDSPWWPGDTVR